MLFKLSPDSPRFEVFDLLNAELLFFLEHAASADEFDRTLFTEGAVGDACWENARENYPRAKSALTRDKFEFLFDSINAAGEDIKTRLYDAVYNNQSFSVFFDNPVRDILDFLPPECFEKLKAISTHLYCATKDLIPIIRAAGGTDITAHFNAFRAQAVNGNICKACGMKELAAFRAGIVDGEQWRADYDHQLCKSKYPIFAVHPDNLIPLCDVCNQDAKKAKDLFKYKKRRERLAFYPYAEEAQSSLKIEISEARDPEPKIKVVWDEQDPNVLDKLNTWDEIYEIRSRVEGKFRAFEQVIINKCNTRDPEELKLQIRIFSREPEIDTLKSEEWSFWYYKLFAAIESSYIEAFIAKSGFVQQQGEEGGDFILNFN